MYKLLLILIIILAILYTIDNKPLNIVIDFILIIINISILIFYIDIIDLSFFSFILVIIYASALAILFGLIMMLFNNVSQYNLLSTSHIFKYKENIFPLKLSYNFKKKRLCQDKYNIILPWLSDGKSISIINILYIIITSLLLIYIVYIYNNIFNIDYSILMQNIYKFGEKSSINDNLCLWSTIKTSLINIYNGISSHRAQTLEIKLGCYNNIDIIKIIFSNVYNNNYINIIIIIIILLISLIGIIFLLI